MGLEELPTVHGWVIHGLTDCDESGWESGKELARLRSVPVEILDRSPPSATLLSTHQSVGVGSESGDLLVQGVASDGSDPTTLSRPVPSENDGGWIGRSW